MGAEVWQFVAAAIAGAVAIALWIVFVYAPRNTGEGAPPVDPPEEEGPTKHD